MRIVPPPAPETADRILDIAERLVQTQGFNGFSYADISAELGITKASLHYHFASKAELGAKVLARYHQAFARALEQIDAGEREPLQKLRRYAALYSEVLRGKRMCLCGMLAADYGTLPAPMKEGVIAFFDDNEAWLAEVLEAGRKKKSLRFSGKPQEQARMLLGSLEGAMLVARSYGEVARFAAAAERIIAEMGRK